MVWFGGVWQGKVWFGHKNFCGMVWRGGVWQGKVWFGEALLGLVWTQEFLRFGLARCGAVRFGMVRQCLARSGLKSFRGVVWWGFVR